ncbi:MAG: NAD-dependent epimerase/dehydratase family protein [Sideroxyarcus sp.]|nr:NAD-dependent epimerase/dehydratase family protein [Sideroxyarcus sp.]
MLINIVGGSGFIGTRLSTLLKRDGVEFKIVDKAISGAFPNQTVLADVRSVEALEAAISENAILINLAAEHRDDVRPLSLYDEVNVQGARNLCAVARQKGINEIIFTSTVAVYGFAPLGTDETGEIAPFNEYGQSKYAAELVFKEWQQEDPFSRSLVIVRPTVAFGEQNRGNVYNLLRQIASGRFVMIGKGENLKSMAYVENIAAFLKFATSFQPGVHVYNYIDKPDFTMNKLVGLVHRILGKPEDVGFRLPYAMGFIIGKGFDLIAAITGRRFAISSIRVKKFCSNSMFNTLVGRSGFVPPVPLVDAFERTVRHEFIESHEHESVFYSE